MASTRYTGTVTQLAAPWCNDTDTLVYAVFGAASTVAQALAALGLTKVAASAGLAITGSTLDSTPIGDTTPAAAAFTDVQTPHVAGPHSETFHTQQTTPYGSVGLMNNVLNANAPHTATQILAGGTWRVRSTNGVGELVFSGGGVLTVNAEDDGVSDMVVGGSVSAAGFTIRNPEPDGDFGAVCKSYMDQSIAQALQSIPPLIGNAFAALGSMASQAKDAVQITGGSLDGVPIGGSVASTAVFTQATASRVIGQGGQIVYDNVGTFGLTLSASTGISPDIVAQPNLNGSFQVRSGGKVVFSANSTGRTSVGSLIDDGMHRLQVYGNTLFEGKTTFAGGTSVGVRAAGFGGECPSIHPDAPVWINVRVKTVDGIKECTMPAWIVNDQIIGV